jgi:phosphomannomutase
MALIKSISGIRGTIGGRPGEGLTPLDTVKFAAAYGTWLLKKHAVCKVVIGRDGRMSGPMVSGLVAQTLVGLGIDVIDLGLSTTPTVELAVPMEGAQGGIILTASHNPMQWNALKLLNERGEFLSGDDGAEILVMAANDDFDFALVDKLGTVKEDNSYLQKHIDAVLHYPLVNREAISQKQFKVVVDVINSTGAIFVPALLSALGVNDVILLNEEITGKFAHNPEPLPEHLIDLSNAVVAHQAHLGIVVDPDVDRLAFVCEDGEMFGEEYTLVAVADYILGLRQGNTVSNMSSTKSLREITEKHGGQYFPSAVGEVNVVKKMKEVNAVIGGEGNGGIIVPDFHYGRDALIGIGLFLSHLALSGKTMRALRNIYPDYVISKNKIELSPNIDVKRIFGEIEKKYAAYPINTEDGLKITLGNDWVHLRTSNTEPIIRIYSESDTEEKANELAYQIMADIRHAT